MRSLICPNCHTAMYQIPHTGAAIDRCAECGGVFLERGELDAVVAALRDAEQRREQEQAQGQGPLATTGGTRRGWLGGRFDPLGSRGRDARKERGA